MPKSIVVSNNPSVKLRLSDVFVNGPDVLSVLEAVRNYVHLGHALLTHPFMGSVKPNENPFRSVVIAFERTQVDYQSVQIVEGCLSVARRMLAERPLRIYPSQVMDDLALIDKSLLESGLESLRLSGRY